MALAKFSDWMMNENDTLQNPNMPLQGSQENEDEANIAQFRTVFDNLLRKMNQSKTISKPVLLEMLRQFIKAVEEKSKSVGSGVQTGLRILSKKLSN
jgi:hypothetical protein